MSNLIQARRGTSAQRLAVILSNGELGWDTDVKQLFVGDGVTYGGNPVTSTQLSFKNKVINGNFDFWQRGTSVAAAAQILYLADRWKLTSVGTTIAGSQQAFALGQGVVPYEPTNFHRCVVASVAGASNLAVLQHNIEGVRTLAGRTCAVSFWAKADANKNMAIEFSQDFGTGGSPSSPVQAIGSQLVALTTTWTKYTLAVALPSIVGKTLGTSGDTLRFNFWFDAGSSSNARAANLGQQSGTFDIAQVQIEDGTAATAFELRPLQIELALCQRYYEKSYDVSVAPGAISSAGTLLNMAQAANNFVVIGNVVFKASKRTAPTMTAYSPATGTTGLIRNNGTAADIAANIINAGHSGAVIRVNNVAVSVGNDLYVHWTADAEL